MAETTEATKTIKTRRDLEDAVIRRFLADEAFRASLLANPKEAVADAIAQEWPGAKLPTKLQVQTIQEPANTLCIVLPAVSELSESDLENVAGGKPPTVEGTIAVKIGW